MLINGQNILFKSFNGRHGGFTKAKMTRGSETRKTLHGKKH